MKRRRDAKARSIKPAIGALVISAAIATASLWPRGPGAGPWPTGPADVDPSELVVGDESPATGADQMRDLLALHGSWDPRASVRGAFRFFEFPTALAAPAGEVGAPAPRWVGDDPPQLRLGVVLISDLARRAVLDGRVVGIGDAVQQATVTGIERGCVTVTWSGRRLTYDLDGPVPREFRSELAARTAEGSDGGNPDQGEAAANGSITNESAQKETGK
jgi:hypothetical protein